MEARVTESFMCMSQAPLGANPGIRKVHTRRDEEEETVRSGGPWPSLLFNPSRTLILGQALATLSKNRETEKPPVDSSLNLNQNYPRSQPYHTPGVAEPHPNPKRCKLPAFMHRWSSRGLCGWNMLESFQPANEDFLPLPHSCLSEGRGSQCQYIRLVPGNTEAASLQCLKANRDQPPKTHP